MNIVNLTPHEIVIMDEHKKVIRRVAKSGLIARLSTDRVLYKIEEDILFWKTDYGRVILIDENDDHKPFPLARPETIYIVSGLFLSGIVGMGGFYGDERDDLWSPGELVRDDNESVIGCIGLSK